MYVFNIKAHIIFLSFKKLMSYFRQFLVSKPNFSKAEFWYCRVVVNSLWGYWHYNHLLCSHSVPSEFVWDVWPAPNQQTMAKLTWYINYLYVNFFLLYKMEAPILLILGKSMAILRVPMWQGTKGGPLVAKDRILGDSQQETEALSTTAAILPTTRVSRETKLCLIKP